MSYLIGITSSAWAGALGLFALGLAPIAFRVLEREAAGRLVLALMPGLQWTGLVLCSISMLAAAARWGRGGVRRGRAIVTLVLAVGVSTAMGHSAFMLLPEMQRLAVQRDASGAPAAVERFAALHRRSTRLLAGVFLGALALVVLEAVPERSRGAVRGAPRPDRP